MRELIDAKVSRSVLRGEGRGDAPDLLGRLQRAGSLRTVRLRRLKNKWVAGGPGQRALPARSLLSP